MDVFEAISKRYSCRSYQDKSIEAEKLEKIFFRVPKWRPAISLGITAGGPLDHECYNGGRCLLDYRGKSLAHLAQSRDAVRVIPKDRNRRQQKHQQAKA